MYTIVLSLHIFVCVLLIIAVLIQGGKGTDLGSALGGGSGEMFGPKAPANVMNKITTVIASAFLMLSLTLAIMSGLGSQSIMRSVPIDGSLMNNAPATTQEAPAQQSAPATGGMQEPATGNLAE